jgi:ABC-type phosphate transport system permease subunit
MTRDTIRRVVSAVFVIACGLAVLIALVPLTMILFYVVSQGVQALNVEFFTGC